MNKRLSFLLLLTTFAVFLYSYDIYLSSRINNLTTTNYSCYLSYTDNCRITLNTEHHNMEESNYYLERVESKDYDFFYSESDLDNDTNFSTNLVQREGNILNQDMYYYSNQIKDPSFSKLDRAHDYYPSKYKRDNTGLNILAISDSYGVGAGLINDNDSWPGVLESNLLSKGINVEVSKMVKNGADFPDFLEMLSKKNIKTLDPDIIVISLFQNDFSPISWVSKPEYLRCLSAGLGDNFLDRFARDKISFVYSLILSKRCDSEKFENGVKTKGDDKGKFYINLDSDPLAKWYKDAMKEIIKNADGRPVIIQPLFSGNNDSYHNIKDVLKYLRSIGFIIPEVDSDEVAEYANYLGDKKIFSLYPVDIHYSRMLNNHLIKMSLVEIIKVLENDKKYKFLKLNLAQTPTIIATTPRTFISDENLQLQYERGETPLYVSKLSPELSMGGVKVGDVIDEVFCTHNNRASVRVYLNQKKHSEENLSVEIKSSESQIAVAGIYYSPEGEELFTEIEILKPGDVASFSFSREIIGLLFGAPKSGCAEEELWTMPSFIAQLTYSAQ
jgi:hypothetical protein